MKFAAYGLYCAVAGSLWIAHTLLAPTWPGLLLVCWHDGVVAVVFAAFALRGGGKPPWRSLAEVGGWCALLFVGPELVSEHAGGHVGAGLATLVIGLVPVVTVVFAAGRDEDAMGLLLPAAVGVAGLGLVIPFSWPGSFVGIVWLGVLAGLAVAMAAAGLRLHRLLLGVPLLCAGAVGAGFSAVVAGGAWVAGPHGVLDWGWRNFTMETAWGLGVDGLLVWLVLWLLREMEPVALSGRFLMIPAVTLLGGIFIERPEVGWIEWLGLGMAVGAGVMLVWPRIQGFFR